MMTFWPVLAIAATLSACGGSNGDSPAASTATPAATPTETATGANAYAAALAQLNTSAGLTSPAVAAALDDRYLDSGMSKPQVVDSLGKEAGAMAASSEHSLFPQVALSNVAVTGCNANNICTMTGTLSNVDGDGTSVDFSTSVVNTNGTYRLLGDQQAG